MIPWNLCVSERDILNVTLDAYPYGASSAVFIWILQPPPSVQSRKIYLPEASSHSWQALMVMQRLAVRETPHFWVSAHYCWSIKSLSSLSLLQLLQKLFSLSPRDLRPNPYSDPASIGTYFQGKSQCFQCQATDSNYSCTVSKKGNQSS